MGIGILEAHVLLGKEQKEIEMLTSSKELQQIIKANGLRKVYVENDRTAVSMIQEVFYQFKESPDYIIIAHSLPYLMGKDKLCANMRKIPLINMSGTPCCIMHQAVQNAVELIKNKRYRKILIIGADKCYANYERIFFGTAMSDSVVGIMLSDSRENDIICGTKLNTWIIASNGVYSEEDTIKRFRRSNATFIKNIIFECLEENGFALSDLEYVICHTSNQGIWDQVSVLTKIPRSNFLDINITQTGHMNSNDSFYHYMNLKERGIIKQGKLVALVNPGFGGSQGCTLIRS